MNYFKSNWLNWLVTIGLIVLFGFIYHSFFTPKVGYVRTGALLAGYKGMIDANKQFETETKTVYANLDTLRFRYLKEQKTPSLRFKSSIEDVKRYEEATLKQLDEHRQELTKNVLIKVNETTKTYGESNNFSVILGATSEGSILYGKTSDDITDAILKKLNEEYASGNK